MAKNPPYDQSVKDAFYREYENNGGIASRAAKVAGVGERQGRRWAARLNADPSIQEAADIGGIEDTNLISGFWKIVKDKDGNGHSIYVKNPDAGGEDIPISEMVQETIEDALSDKLPQYEKRQSVSEGDKLLIVTLADVHFRKLCVKTETGFEYNSDIARHRVIEGTKRLLEMSSSFGISRILFELGNDALHTDSLKEETTNGTPQDTVGNYYQGYNVATRSLKHAIELCTQVADVDLIHSMSNHDRLTGWMLSQTVAALFEAHPNVHTTDYNLSEIYTKYYRYGNALIGLTHGDNLKAEQLYATMVQEAREHISECPNMIWLLHHLHHAIRTLRGKNKPIPKEKDHGAMTALMTGTPRVEGHHLDCQHIRSPSPADAWHHRNGFINRQAVECFVVDPIDGIKARFTEWF